MTTRAKLSPAILSVLAKAAPAAARALSTGDALIEAATAAEVALEALRAASELHRKVGSKTTLAMRDAAERASRLADEREFEAGEAHESASIVAA